jgi:hypothetical protein
LFSDIDMRHLATGA